VEEFKLMSIEGIKAALVRKKFRPDCIPVMTHFFMRHGAITPENKEYAELEMPLHRRLPVPISPEQDLALL
jgi:hypothetical protein